MLGGAAAQPAAQLQSLAALLASPDILIGLFSSASEPEGGFVTLNTLRDRPGATKQVRTSEDCGRRPGCRQGRVDRWKAMHLSSLERLEALGSDDSDAHQPGRGALDS